jgi:hypothetical protein
MSDQLVAKPPPKHSTTQIQNKRIQSLNIHVLSGIRTHDPSVQESESRPSGYRDRLAISNTKEQRKVPWHDA